MPPNVPPRPPLPRVPVRAILDDDPVSPLRPVDDIYASEAQEETLRVILAVRAALDRISTDTREGFAKVFHRMDHQDEDFRSIRQVQATQGSALLNHSSLLEKIDDRLVRAEGGLQRLGQAGDLHEFAGRVLVEVERLKQSDAELRKSHADLQKSDAEQDKKLAEHESRLTAFAKRYGPAALAGSAVTGIAKFVWDVASTGKWPW